SLFTHPAREDTGADGAECEPDQRWDGEGRHERAPRELPYSPYRAHNARASMAEIISSPKPVARGKPLTSLPTTPGCTRPNQPRAGATSGVMTSSPKRARSVACRSPMLSTR